MQIVKNKEKVGNIIFAIGILLELLVMVTDHAPFVTLPFRGRFTHVAFVLFAVKILLTYYTWPQWILMAASGMLGMVSYLTCGDEYVIRVVVFLFATKQAEIEKVLKMILYVMMAATILIVGLSLLGIAGNISQTAYYGRGDLETRYMFGFNHANNFHDVVWYIMAMLLLLTHQKWDWKHYLLATIGNIGLFFLTVSRNGMIAVQLLLTACFVLRYFPKLNKMKFPYILGGIGLTLCLWMTWLGGAYGAVNDSLTAFLDRFLTGRLEMIWEYAPISAWKVFPEGRSLSFVDNGFASLFFHYGYVVGTVYIVLLLYLLYRLYKKRDGISLSVLVTAIFVTFIETTFVFNTSLLCNVVLIVMMLCWKSDREV